MTQAETYDSITPFYAFDVTDTAAVDTSMQADTVNYLLMCNDSVFASYTSDTVTVRQSMFAESIHHDSEVRTELHVTQGHSDWTFALIVLLLTIMSLYLNSRKFRLKDIFMSLFDMRVMDRIARESNTKPRSMLPMVGIYLACITLIATEMSRHWIHPSASISAIGLYLVVFGALSLFITLKNGLIHLLGNIFEDKTSTTLYVTNSHLFHFVGAVTLTPLSLLILYGNSLSKTATTVAVIITCTIFLIRLLRGFQLILTNSKTSKLYLFYYLCILELVPILVAVKIIFI